MADSLLTRLLLQSSIRAMQHEWFVRNPERFRDLVEIFAAVITGRPRRDLISAGFSENFGRRDLGISARSRPDFGRRDKGISARSRLDPKISAVKIVSRISPRSRQDLGENFARERLLNFKLVSRCLLFFKMTSRQEYRSKLSCYCLKSYVRKVTA